jgi:citrate lyase subunit beta/citryl-CoA lyase
MAAYRLPALVARSFLFVPGIEHGKLERAWSRGADVVVIDLEDSVPSGRKDEARSVTVERLGRLDERDRGRTWLRVNNEPGLLEADLASVPRRGAAGVLVPKVPSAERAEALRSAVDHTIGSEVGFIPMIESAEAVLDVQEIAGVRGVTTLMLGEYDLTAELGMSPDRLGAELSSIRVGLVVACAASGIAPPIAAVSADFADADAFRESSTLMRRMGFFGRAVIHPDQVAIANAVFTPTTEELEEAERTLAAWAQEAGAIARDGVLVDEATVRHARRLRALGDRLRHG